MRKLIAIGIAVLLVAGAGSLAYADSIGTSKTVTAHLPVDSQFGFTIWDTEFDQMLANVLPGGGDTGDLHIAVTTNHDAPFYVKASSAGLVGETQAVPDTLPVVITTYDGGAGLNGTPVTDLTLTGTAANIYSAGAGDYPASGLEIGCIFAVTSLAATKQDLYTGTIVLTMTE